MKIRCQSRLEKTKFQMISAFTSQRVNSIECTAKCLMKNVADPCTAAQFRCLNIPCRSFDG